LVGGKDAAEQIDFSVKAVAEQPVKVARAVFFC
jgi:hypothetical protein